MEACLLLVVYLKIATSMVKSRHNLVKNDMFRLVNTVEIFKKH